MKIFWDQSLIYTELHFLLELKMLASVLCELKGKLQLREQLLCKIVLARKIAQCGNKA